MADQAQLSEAIARHYEKRAAQADAQRRCAWGWYNREWARKARAGRANPFVRRVWRRFLTPQPGDRYETPSGMGGVFTVRLLALSPDGTWQVRVDMPLNPDWDRYLIDGVRTDQLLPVRSMEAH